VVGKGGRKGGKVALANGEKDEWLCEVRLLIRHGGRRQSRGTERTEEGGPGD